MVEYEYAKALFELAKEENKLEIFLDDILVVVDTTSKETEFKEIMNSPTIEKRDKLAIIEKVYNSLDTTFLNFLKVLVNNKRFSLIEGIKDEFVKLYEDYKKILKLEVISSEVLSEAQFKQIIKRLELRYPGKELKIKNSVNPKILGGLQIICNGESLDISLKGQLNKLKESL